MKIAVVLCREVELDEEQDATLIQGLLNQDSESACAAMFDDVVHGSDAEWDALDAAGIIGVGIER